MRITFLVIHISTNYAQHLQETFAGIPMEMVTATNQLVTSLVKQAVPKCYPDVFSGDVAMFRSWKSSFKAMVKETHSTRGGAQLSKELQRL